MVNEGSEWTIKSMHGHYLNIAKYNPLLGSSRVELPKELKNSRTD